jgi:NAD(P)-dependent dehydrogenase (short-subunit alcohol dehydrogenase family)
MKVFITGASSGLGAALARHYARHGGNDPVIGIAGRSRERLQTLAMDLAPASCPVYVFDVNDHAAQRAAAQDFIARFGPPDLVFANAGISLGTRGEEEGDLAVLTDILNANVTGLAATLQCFAGPLRSKGQGVLVGIASVAGFRGFPGSGAYSASKAAAIKWLEALRIDLRGSGVRVITVCPGYIATPMTAHNGFRMPFLLEADDAARRIARAVACGRSLVVIPWQMRWVSWLLRLLPPWLFDLAFARAPRKPRTQSASATPPDRS